jgi:hypothetical protein
MVHRANGLVALCDRGFVMNYSFLLMKHVHTHVFEKKEVQGKEKLGLEQRPTADSAAVLRCKKSERLH